MKRALSMILVLCLVLSLSVSATAASGKQYDYSTSSNSGVRHELCTSLLGTSADEYYTGSYTYENLSELSSSSLLSTLRTLMKSTHKKVSSYSDCKNMATKTDCQKGGSKLVTIYTSYAASSGEFQNGNGWNREHVWPKSLGGFENSGAGADLHHIRPSENKTNSNRGNLKYGNVSGGKTSTGNLSNKTGGIYNSTYFEPLDNVKGDVARICLYVYVRYGGEYSQCSNITNVFQSVDVLLQWCEMDPVDTWEMGRNEVVGAIQGNRNVFIDYPELAWLLFGEEIPAGMSTPSGNAADGSTTPTACPHTNTTVQDKKAATCSNPGYTGDTYCNDCEEVIATGTAIGKLAHTNANKDNKCDECGTSVTCGHGKTELRGAKAATCGASGNQDHTYCSYCGDLIKSGQTIPATGKHTFGQWTVTKEPTTTQTGSQERRCSVCDHTETAVIPTIDPPATEPSVPTEPSTPTEPSVPTEPSQPTEPSVPTEPSQPTEPSAPTEPSQPTEPSAPTEPSQPTEPSAPTEPAGCSHDTTIHRNASTATCTKDGYTGDTYCILCGRKIIVGTVIAATGHSNNNGDTSCDTCGADLNCTHATTQLQGAKEATCGAAGYTGDSVCVACGDVITAGQVIPATGDHYFGEWISNEDLSSRTCEDCGYAEIQYNTPTEPTETEPAPTETEPAPSETQPAPTQPSTAPTVPSEPSLAPSTQPATEESAAPSTTPVQPEPGFPMTPVIIGIVILAAAAIVILILKKKKA